MKLRSTLINCMVIVCAMFYSSAIMANIINVPADHSTIQAAIGASSTGDTILVQAGTYNGLVNFNGKAITVGSLFLTTSDEAHIATTIINGNGSVSCVKFNSGETSSSVLTGFAITNGYAYYGAGIYCSSGSSPTLSHLDIVNNNGHPGDSYGGAVCCLDNSNPTCSNLTMSGNYAQAGGAVYCHNNSEPNFTDCVFTNNNANHGGAILTSYSHPQFNYCAIYENTANSAGAGVYASFHSQPDFTNCTVVDNTTPGWGGGFYCNDIYGEPNILNCIVWGNSSDYNLQIFATVANPIVTYTDVQDGTGEDWFGTGCLDTDPLFVNAANNDYHLTDSSPCIDAGDPTSPPDPDGSNADQGAFPNFASFVSDFYATPTNICEGSPVEFTDNSVGDPTSWSWIFEGGTPETSIEQSPTVIYNTPGEYDVTLFISNGTDNSTLVKQNYIVVNTIPTPEITGSALVCGNQEFEYETENIEGNTYEWTVIGGEIINGSGTNQITVLWGVPGQGTVELIEISENCAGSAETLEVIIDDCTGFEEVPLSSLNIYPNPATNYINIQSENLIKTIWILDSMGKKVACENAYNKLCQLNTSILKPGIYLLIIKTETAEYMERMIIE